ncbi:MAG: DUF4012 domain-containing protein, partial [Candidatus Liptonbacteria bacterium]|nr:DUF4012 domain-containing protein [Candidatus Liptonbacteria bacterium]
VFYFFYFYQSKLEFLKKTEESLENSGISAKFDLSGGQMEIKSFEDLKTKIWPMLKGGFDAYQGLSELAGIWLKFAGDADEFRSALFSGLSGAKTGLIFPALKNLKDDVSAMNRAVDKIDINSPGIKDFLPISPDKYLSIKYEINFWDKALDSAIAWLSSDRKIIVFFQNSSEMRPTGGFWGSFAEINIRNGEISSTTVKDINEVDRRLELKTVPPKPLQALVTNWRTADANWFFDFRDSAARATVFMNASKFYSESQEKVDAVFAISPKTISDLLALTGPVAVSSTKEMVGADNFLPVIQEEVQKGQSAGIKNAKNVLSELFSVIIPRLGGLNGEGGNQIILKFLDWAKSKDVMFWAEDASLESVFEAKGVAGSAFEIPRRFEGDYLAVASANIGGGKSDYVLRQTINFESQINLDGTVNNHLEIIRVNNAKKNDKWWYRTANQSYTRVFLPEGSIIQGGLGGIAKTVYPPINYKSKGYAADPKILKLEAGESKVKGYPWLTEQKDAGKSIFAFWTKTPPGGTSKVVLDYTRRLFVAPADGISYQFVFDKQPGVNGEYSFSFSAPAGFTWKENGSTVYEYKGSDLPGQLILELTLNKSD